ncbi:MAG: hypothetical protein H6868_08275 [Rhodospirillales bacterium]|nr:hypothetical protein [Rhodospirillales bacterium]
MNNPDNPLYGFPKTVEHFSAFGSLEYRISFPALTPLRAKIAEAFGYGLATLGGYGLFQHLQGRADAAGDFAPGIAFGFLFTYPAWQWLCRWALTKTTRLTLSVDAVRIRRWHGWQKFDRTLPHSFALLRHDKTRQEERKNDFKVRRAQADGEVILPKEYYGRSLHLVLDYVGHRIDITEIMGAKKAQTVLARLNAIDAILDRQSHHGSGMALAPTDDWGRDPGEV